jgi:phosphoglycolate phosphatase
MKVILDFDGVIHDAFDSAYQIHRLAAEKIGKAITEDEYRNLFSVGSFHKNLEDFLGLNQQEMERFLSYKYHIYSDCYGKAKMYSFAFDLISSLKSKGADLEIVSSAPKEQIESKLRACGLLEKFSQIFGINKGGKAENLKGGDFFITDTVGDIMDGKKAGIKVIAVSWGYGRRQDLVDANPDFLIDDYKEIIKIIYG